MHIIRDVWHCPQKARNAVVALGNFDGVHRGHRHLLELCLEHSKALSSPAGVLTFEPHPRMFFKPGTPSLRIQSFRQKAINLSAMGMEFLFVARFNRALATTPASDFVERLLVEALGVRHVVVGENFCFGKDRGGDIALLRSLAQRHGFGITAVPIQADTPGQPYSSSRLRAALAEGDMATAQSLLGRAYTISGHVQQGRQVGRGLGAPTANLRLEGILAPRYGVYAARVRIHPEDRWHDAVVNLGIRPTFGDSEPILETHLLDHTANLYSARLCVQLLHFLRPEQKFDSPEALRTQIHHDITLAKEHLRHV